jgi:RNA polymerase sigma-70 factor (ECF subfamily)
MSDTPDTPQAGTRITLLERVRDNQAVAWEDFVALYGPKVYGWCRTWKLQEADARDVTQDVLLKLVVKMRAFTYDRSRGGFRAWLKTVTQHALSDFLAARRRPELGTGDSEVAEQLASVAAREDLARHVEAAFEHELFEQAAERVRARVAARTWEAFHLTAQQGLAGAEVSARIGMQVAQVFVAKRRVQKMLQEEVRKLEGET